jgi:glycogen operon protein
VDGFRFDLASVFARDSNGALMADPPLPWAIEASRTLAPLPLIAEAWDAVGLYHVGAFPGMAWAEWNGRYRDVMRRFVRGDPGLTGEVATRIAGSADLYADDGRRPANGINFVTCHDGFTLNDLVSYDAKRNFGNGEDNRDGTDDNVSWGCGADGETADAVVLARRRRQARNHLALLMLSRGVPMLLAGDEVLRSQGGNNNPYCQDNEVSWFDWSLRETSRDMLRFTRELIALRRRHPCLTSNRFFTGAPLPGRGIPDIAWHGPRLDEPPWHDAGARLLRFTLGGLDGEEADLHVICNMGDATAEVLLPRIADRRWQVALDTARDPPEDIVPPSLQRPHASESYPAAPRSVVVLEAHS